MVRPGGDCIENPERRKSNGICKEIMEGLLQRLRRHEWHNVGGGGHLRRANERGGSAGQ